MLVPPPPPRVLRPNTSIWVAWVLCGGLIGFAAWVDMLTGPRLIVDPLYLLPVGLAGWYRAKGLPLLVPLASAFLAEAMHLRLDPSPEQSDQFVWNVLVRLIVAGTAVLVVRGLRSALEAPSAADWRR